MPSHPAFPDLGIMTLPDFADKIESLDTAELVSAKYLCDVVKEQVD